MRLLQLITGPNELIDLHPNVTVITGLSEEQREALAATIAGLAVGRSAGTAGLVEAHGILFDLTPGLLDQISPSVDDVDPVVRAVDLPLSRASASARTDLLQAQRALAAVLERAAAAAEDHERATAAATATEAARAAARRALDDHHASMQDRIGDLDTARSAVDDAVERAREAEAAVAALVPQVSHATTARLQVEEETAAVRARLEQARDRRQALALSLDQARADLDPDAAELLVAAEAQLAAVEATVAEERGEQSSHDDSRARQRSIVDLRARHDEIVALLVEVDRRLAAFAPASREEVAAQLARVRSIDGTERIESPEAMALAARIDEVDRQLAALPSANGTSASSAAVTARLDRARQAHLEAEQAVRGPELDRGLVEQLEDAHGAVLDVMDKADRRFGGARVQKKLEELRSHEDAVLRELGFMSYADYMMGSSLLHVDPEKEAALEASRAELASAEDEWRLQREVNEAELTRAEVQERRRLLVDEARRLLGHPAPAGEISNELRTHRVEGSTKAAAGADLQVALGRAGLALGDAPMPLDEVLLLAEAWLDEIDVADDRQHALERERGLLRDEQAELAATLGEAAQESGPAADPEIEWAARVEAASRAVDAARARVTAHEQAEVAVRDLESRLDEGADDEAAAAPDGTAAEAGLADAIVAEQRLVDALASLEAEAAVARQEVREREAALQDLQGPGAASVDDLAAALHAAGAAHDAAIVALDAVVRRRQDVDAERAASHEALAAARSAAGAAPDDASVAEEVEWYLLARLAAQRSVSLGGSTPLLLDDALRGMAAEDVQQVLDRLEHMAETVQVIVVSEDPTVSAWALLAGTERAAVVRPQAA